MNTGLVYAPDAESYQNISKKEEEFKMPDGSAVEIFCPFFLFSTIWYSFINTEITDCAEIL